ncbi:MAG: carboxymuconolactone decarboxylase family protein [Nitrospiraceae bacterium]|nr:carboxymuconolactone decarboxylase family protein [Nitrospiraceae bacterium]
MDIKALPGHYSKIRKRFPEYASALDKLGEAARCAGPLDEKTAHLIQMAAAAAVHSEGAVHSHTRRALMAGAEKEEIYHALLLLTSTVGFPTVAAALSWADDILKKKEGK